MSKNKNKYSYKTVKSGSGAYTPSTVVRQKLEELPLKNRPKLIVSKELKRQIDFFHKEVGSDEWSGVLHFNIIKGDISDLDNLVVKAEIIYLMDIGTSAYTEYEMNEEIMDFYDKYPGAEDMKKGHCHSHGV